MLDRAVAAWRRMFLSWAVMIYVAGATFHGMRLLYRFPFSRMPTFMDGVIVVVGLVVGGGFLRFWPAIAFRGTWHRVLCGLVVVHLLGSAVLHAYVLAVASHDVLEVFPIGFSVVAIAYFGLLGVTCALTRLRG